MISKIHEILYIYPIMYQLTSSLMLWVLDMSYALHKFSIFLAAAINPEILGLH